MHWSECWVLPVRVFYQYTLSTVNNIRQRVKTMSPKKIPKQPSLFSLLGKNQQKQSDASDKTELNRKPRIWKWARWSIWLQKQFTVRGLAIATIKENVGMYKIKYLTKNITCKYHVTCGRINNTSENQQIFLNIGGKSYMPYLTLWDKNSLNFQTFLQHILWRNKQTSHFVVFITNFIHYDKGFWLFWRSFKVIFVKISQNFIKSHLKNCLISQISIHSLWQAWKISLSSYIIIWS